MTPPFTDAKMPEVVARVAIQIVKLRYLRNGARSAYGPAVVQACLDDLSAFKGRLIYSALLALQFHLIRGGASRTWLSAAIAASRLGCGFRRCWYDDYKGARRDPRVTNRRVRGTTQPGGD